MIYCVVPEPLADELYNKLAAYYEDDPTVTVVVHVDGGARGNPGPAAAAAVISSPDGEVLAEAAERIGTATNNIAEYRGLLLGLERARALGADDVEVVNDSELIAKQVNGEYKVK